MSLLNKYPCTNVTAPTYLSYSSASVTILSAIVASVGNMFVVLAVLLDPNKELRSPFTYFVANLAVADLIVGLITCPLGSIYLISEALKQPNQQFRVWMHMSYFISSIASLLSLTVLAIERYVAITFPLDYRAKLNPVRAFLVFVVVWIASVLLSLNYFLVGYNRFRFIFANTAVVVTFSVLIFTNTKIVKYLRLQVHQWDNVHDSKRENLAKKQAMKLEKKITKTLMVVLILFLACYLPSCVCIYIINLCSKCDCEFIHWVRDIQFVLVMANSGVNPFVYAWRLKNFKKAFKSILSSRACFKRTISVNTVHPLIRYTNSASSANVATDTQIEIIEEH